MPRWDIDPAGVRGVVTRTTGEARAFEGQATTYADKMQSAVTASGSQIVGQALVDFATYRQTAFSDLTSTTSRVLTGAVEATLAYMHGDLQMAETAQKNAVTDPNSVPIRLPSGKVVPQ
jgi:hypothetical protein